MRVEGSGFRVQGLGSRVQGYGLRVKVQGSEFRVRFSGLGFRGFSVVDSIAPPPVQPRLLALSLSAGFRV